MTIAVAGILAIADRVTDWITPPAPPSNAAAAVSDSDLGGFASTAATDYLSWTTEDRDRRRAVLARYAAPSLSVDGWAGDGRQWADSPAVVAITRADPTRAVVTVRVRVTPYVPERADQSSPVPPNASSSTPNGPADRGGDTASAGIVQSPGWRPGSARWVAVAMPVGVVADRLAMVQRPALVGTPSVDVSTASSLGPAPVEDTASRSTREVVTKMLTAYATGDLEFIRASGSRLAGLGGAAELGQVTSWALHPGEDGDSRQGMATVTWRLSGGAGSLTCAYILRLREQDGRWYLAGLSVPVDGVPG
ncbi:conjugal transfer protein [Kibdelosporangium phytohabitans]|uniref:Uncharacterized protein n=1 Tax=Kibdelosporangium phytohabitans TaxID=860235 RepID=A0A0N9HP38_9PSEU|nr:conjugal transfer protein [Kibdelosporangium phytohabitans]ALG06376.1 hypothetical protein AOZ06_05055 [Kibdelosporangium phytohabitans]MBE1467519.1 hypothetical protein [Kibdelosporangium phytohabitans]